MATGVGSDDDDGEYAAAGAADDIVSQAFEEVVLEQLAALNTLPSIRQPASEPTPPATTGRDADRHLNHSEEEEFVAVDAALNYRGRFETLEGLKSPIDWGFGDSDLEIGGSSSSTPSLDDPRRRHVGIGGGGRRSPPASLPPRQTMLCCFSFSTRGDDKYSPRRPRRKDGERGGGGSLLLLDDAEEMLSDLRTFSAKEQRRELKKAMEEQERASREAERMVEWVKQASARMDVEDIDELLDD